MRQYTLRLARWQIKNMTTPYDREAFDRFRVHSPGSKVFASAPLPGGGTRYFIKLPRGVIGYVDDVAAKDRAAEEHKITSASFLSGLEFLSKYTPDWLPDSSDTGGTDNVDE